MTAWIVSSTRPGCGFNSICRRCCCANVSTLPMSRLSRPLSLTMMDSRRWALAASTVSPSCNCSANSSAYRRMLVNGVFSSWETWFTKLTRVAASRSSRDDSR